MTRDQFTSLTTIFDGLLARYRTRVPDAVAITDAMVREGIVRNAADIENDHLAFRTVGVPSLGIASLERIFLHYGYQRRDRYDFPKKKVTAYWYSPPRESLPRIFISELRVHELSPQAGAIVRSYTDPITVDPLDALDLDDGHRVVDFLHAPLWRKPTWPHYRRLLEESEFAAWVIHNRLSLNHFTLAVHDLPAGYDTVESFNRFLERKGFTLNDAGGKVKISADGKLLQSSTVAVMVEADFDDGAGGSERHRVSGSYVEFAERRVLDEFASLAPDQLRREHRREGFEAASADRIFESTDTAQIRRRV